MAEIDDFLTGKANLEPAPEAEAPPAPEQEAAPEGEAPPPPAEGEPEPQQQTRDGRTVPLSALEGERKARQDWKDKAARAETERDELRKQLEEIKQRAQQPPPAVNPAEDPQGFVSRVQEVVLNERLNTSELLARQAHGAETVEKAIEEFKAAAQADPSLFPKLYANQHPYDWMVKQVEKLRVQREMGDDPAAYRARIIAEERAKWEAEAGQQPAPRVSPAAGLAPSLANVRSAAPRGAPAFSGPTPMGDLLPNG